MGAYTVTKRKAPLRDYVYVRKAKEGNTVPMAILEPQPSKKIH